MMNENQVRCWSLWQPFADGCVNGEKKIETRGRNVNVRGTVYIHATNKTFVPESVYIQIYESTHGSTDGYIGSEMNRRAKGNETYGAIIGSVVISGCYPIEKLYGDYFDTPLERAYGDWTEGRYGIILSAPRRFKTPIPAKGHQGFWFFDKSLIEEVEKNDD